MLAGLNVQRDVPKRERANLAVAEIDVLQADLAAKPVRLPDFRAVLLRRRLEDVVEAFDVTVEQLKLTAVVTSVARVRNPSTAPTASIAQGELAVQDLQSPGREDQRRPAARRWSWPRSRRAGRERSTRSASTNRSDQRSTAACSTPIASVSIPVSISN